MSTSATYSARTFTAGNTFTAAQANVLDAGIYDTHYPNSGAHNSIFRGKSLGTAMTSTQAGYISNATFADLFVGDYWTISSKVYRIAGFDYWYNCYSSTAIGHNAIVVPDATMYNAPMNSTNTTSGAYVGSAMYTCEEITVSDVTYTGLANAISTLQSAFGDYLLTYENYLANAVTNGYPSAQAWYTDRVCDLMTEQMVYGSACMQQMSYGGTLVANRRIGKSQLPLFALNPRYINIRATWWLSDVVSSACFAFVTATGNASASDASNANGVRPAFLVS
ncbi:MAG: hypothetical protein LUI87_02330 [Lachnospiraceae bacterium]|nr:hypothetical protein [Lachnospiraceae bacterium]